MKIKENIPLGPFTTFGIGGPARFFMRAESEEQVSEAFEYARLQSLDVFVLGSGSNILVADSGFDGLVMQVALKGIVLSEPSSGNGVQVNLTAQAGEDWGELVAYCNGHNLAGIECLSGIPGIVGATPVQNVGAYGQEVAETIVSVRCFDRSTGKIAVLTNAQCGFAYRTSIFNTSARDRYVVLAVTYILERHGKPKIVYKDLREYFAGREPTLAETREGVLQIRRAKSMVIDPDDPNSRSVGSFFKNPIVSTEEYLEIAAAFAASVPSFKVDDGSVKIPAAWLIENAGFYKGYALGNAGISANHTLAIINRGGAMAVEIIALKDRIQSAVEEKFGIFLQPEPIFIGF